MAALVMVLWITGIAMRMWAGDDSVLEAPPWQAEWRHAAVVIHGVLAWLFCVVTGRWIWPHTTVFWRKRSHTLRWWLGLLTALISICLAIGGLCLLYGSPPLREITTPVHWWAGLVWPVVIALHTRVFNRIP